MALRGDGRSRGLRPRTRPKNRHLSPRNAVPATKQKGNSRPKRPAVATLWKSPNSTGRQRADQDVPDPSQIRQTKTPIERNEKTLANHSARVSRSGGNVATPQPDEWTPPPRSLARDSRSCNSDLRGEDGRHVDREIDLLALPGIESDLRVAKRDPVRMLSATCSVQMQDPHQRVPLRACRLSFAPLALPGVRCRGGRPYRSIAEEGTQPRTEFGLIALPLVRLEAASHAHELGSPVRPCKPGVRGLRTCRNRSARAGRSASRPPNSRGPPLPSPLDATGQLTRTLFSVRAFH